MESKKNSPILEICGINKIYETNHALKDLSLSIPAGGVFGLLGPNGAGKTTLISILAGIIRDYTGKIIFNGSSFTPDRKTREKLGIVPQDMAFYEELSARDNLMFWGSLYNISGKELKNRVKELLELTALENRASEAVKKFSGGMKRRLNIAIGMLHKPALLLLDEPTVGIDVQAKVNILEIIKRAGETGTTVIFTTHQLSEVEQICTDIAIMDQGSVLARGTMEELIKIIGEEEILDITGEFTIDQIMPVLNKDKDIKIISSDINRLNLSVKDTNIIPDILKKLFKHNIHIQDMKIKSPNLETVFLKLTGRSLRD